MAQTIKVELRQDADAGLKRAQRRLVAIRDSEKVTFCCYVEATYGGTRLDKNGNEEKKGASEMMTTDGRSIAFGYFVNARATALSEVKIDPTAANAREYDDIPVEVLDACEGINAPTPQERLNNYLANCNSQFTFAGALNEPTPVVATMRRVPTGATADNSGVREWYWLVVDNAATKAKRDAMTAAVKAADASKPADPADIAKIKKAIGEFTALDRLNAAQAAAWLAIL